MGSIRLSFSNVCCATADGGEADAYVDAPSPGGPCLSINVLQEPAMHRTLFFASSALLWVGSLFAQADKQPPSQTIGVNPHLPKPARQIIPTVMCWWPRAIRHPNPKAAKALKALSWGW
jgi:hypothetical protein